MVRAASSGNRARACRLPTIGQQAALPDDPIGCRVRAGILRAKCNCHTRPQFCISTHTQTPPDSMGAGGSKEEQPKSRVFVPQTPVEFSSSLINSLESSLEVSIQRRSEEERESVVVWRQ